MLKNFYLNFNLKFSIILVNILCVFNTFLFSQSNIDIWKLNADNINPNNYYGITSANGMIGIVSSAEPLKIKEVILAGTYDAYGRGRVSNFIRGFNFLNSRIEIDGEGIEEKNIKNFNQELDLQNAIFTARFEYRNKAIITYRYLALRHLPFNALLEISVQALQTISINAASVLEAPDVLKNVENYYNEIDRPHTLVHLLTSSANSPTNKFKIVASTTFLFEEKIHEEPKIVHEMWDNNMHLMKFSKNISKGQSYTFNILGAMLSSEHHADPLNEAERLAIFAKLEGKKRLIDRHQNAWKDLWHSRIEIDGDDSTQQDINSMIYHLYAFNREGSNTSSSPMGLSGLGYNGHVFWDSELWMYPALLLLQPDIAKGMIEYRHQRLGAAKNNAFGKGYKGAMFPWESAHSGVEETPVWALSGPFEHHISACVAIATWNYFAVIQDKEWLKKTGWDILESTANFWISRVEKDAQGKHHIYNVVAADEWAENVDDNAFTNAAAKINLDYACAAAAVLGYKANSQWLEVAKTLVLDTMSNGVIKEHTKYNGEAIKQADVNLLAFPLGVIKDKKQILKDLEYYSQRLPDVGTPSMTQATFATLYARLGNGEKAYYWLHDAYKSNTNKPFGVIAETKRGKNPYFATAAGGILQSILMGFGGLDITNTGLQQVTSQLPKKWKQLRLYNIGKDKKNYVINGKTN